MATLYALHVFGQPGGHETLKLFEGVLLDKM